MELKVHYRILNKWVTLRASVREMLGSYLCRGTDCSYWSISWDWDVFRVCNPLLPRQIWRVWVLLTPTCHVSRFPWQVINVDIWIWWSDFILHLSSLLSAPTLTGVDLGLFGWLLLTESESYVTTDGQSASLSWNKAPIWGLRPDFYYHRTVAGLLMWGALSDERTGLSFTIAAGSSQRSKFSGPSHLRLATIFYCLRFETSHFVASYNSQGHGGGIRSRLHTGDAPNCRNLSS
jgi:hypothetical protein